MAIVLGPEPYDFKLWLEAGNLNHASALFSGSPALPGTLNICFGAFGREGTTSDRIAMGCDHGCQCTTWHNNISGKERIHVHCNCTGAA